MLRTCISQQASSSSSRAFHTSAVLSKISEARLRSRAIKKANLQHREQLEKGERETGPSVILGTRPGEEHKWRESYLAQLLVDESVFKQPPKMIESNYGVPMPRYRAFGVTGEVERTLFRDLRQLSGIYRNVGMLIQPGQAAPTAHPENTLREAENQKAKAAPPPMSADALQKAEDQKAARFAQAIDLRNSDAGGIAYENRRRIIEGFSTPANPFDTGRTEVQVALLTYRIREVYRHLKRCKHDVQNKLSLRKLVHQRAKILKYLKRSERARYDILLQQLAIEPAAVEGELVVN
ncbi:hypothetical protein FB45DRAFT_791991 [Roridomyces roridus]|uniref:Ribosomal protein S15 n=1 Tax=Roridomyces roridus TaxID=1738132 RepID=A0AAD7BX14_9AGAR|nr:hypothetical protein FB45DRAFT_791991 [Roridomyces roridus]